MSTSFFRYLMKEGKLSIILPTPLFETEIFKELEKVFLTGNPHKIFHFFDRISANLDQYVSTEQAFNLITNLKKFLSDNNIFLSQDDKKIIKFLSSKKYMPIDDFIAMIGPLYFIGDVINSLKNTKIDDEIIKVSLYMYLFILCYEIVLYQTDRRLYAFLRWGKMNKQEKQLIDRYREKIRGYLNIRRTGYMAHASADIINSVLCIFCDMPEENSSIFGKRSDPRLLRNKLSHINMFYDRGTKKICAGRNNYTMEEFNRQFFQIINFLIEWMYAILGCDIFEQNDSSALRKKILDNLRNMIRDVCKLMKKTGRSGEMQKILNSIVIEFRKSEKLSENR